MKKTIFCLFVVMLIFGATPAYASGSAYTYIYSNDVKVLHSPDAFYPAGTVSNFGDNDSFFNPSDLKVDQDTGNVYVADSGNNRILVFNKDIALINIIEAFTDKDGYEDSFFSPNGLCIYENKLYVCDTGNERIVILDKNGKYIGCVKRPENESLPQDFEFRPLKVAIDMVDRYNIICENNVMGIVVIGADGDFQGFTGAIKVTPSPGELLRRRFMTEKQLENSARLIPSPYSNVRADSDGFIYATTSAYNDPYTIYNMVWQGDKSNSYSPIKRFAPSGDDILNRNAAVQPVGELNFKLSGGNLSGASAIDDVAVTDNGVYTLMDSKYGKLFTYDGEGNLLYAFGGLGTGKGKFSRLVAIDYFGESLLALDADTGTITTFSKTSYGHLLDSAIAAATGNDSALAVELWIRVKEQNNNLDLAYQEIGKSLIKEEKYEEAMTHLKYAGDKENYSVAYKYYRAQSMKKWALIVPVLLALVIWLILRIFAHAKKYNTKHARSSGKRTIREQLVYGLHLVFHPFDGFWDIKNEQRGGVLSATVILLLLIVSYIVSALSSGFLFGNAVSSVNIFNVALGVAGPILLWTIANWSLTSLMDGKGRIGEIYTSTCYAAIPLLFVTVPIAILSNFLILDEIAIISVVSSIALIWVVLLIYGSVVSTHQYTAARALLVCLLTVVVIGFILFLGLLFYSVCERLIGFIQSLITEVSSRN